MSINLGPVPIADLMLGTTPIYWVFQGTVQLWEREIVVVLGNTTNVSLKTVIENAKAGAWADVNLKKRVVVPTGVEIGATTSSYAITSGATSQADSWAGSLTLEVRGTVSGIGGAANSGVGGNAISIPYPGRNGEKLLLGLLSGLLRAGGGGGGKAGNGGQGVWYSGRTVTEGPTYADSSYMMRYATILSGSFVNKTSVFWGGLIYEQGGDVSTGVWIGGVYYYRGGRVYGEGGDSNNYDVYTIARQYTAYDVPNYTPGGVAGNAGRGRGYDGSATSGAGSVAGGTNAGASGKSGDGGDWGQSGQAGANGTTGNYTGGAAGLAAGLAGYYLLGTANVTLTNTGGTLLGRLG